MDYSEEEIHQNINNRLKQAIEYFVQNNKPNIAISRYLFMHLTQFQIIIDELLKIIESLNDDYKSHSAILNINADILSRLSASYPNFIESFKPVIKASIIKISKSMIQPSIEKCKEAVAFYSRKSIFQPEYCNELLNDITLNATNSTIDVSAAGQTYLELTNELLRTKKKLTELPDDTKNLSLFQQFTQQEIAIHEKFIEFHSEQNMIITSRISEINDELEKYTESKEVTKKTSSKLKSMFDDDDSSDSSSD